MQGAGYTLPLAENKKARSQDRAFSIAALAARRGTQTWVCAMSNLPRHPDGKLHALPDRLGQAAPAQMAPLPSGPLRRALTPLMQEGVGKWHNPIL